MAVLPDNIQREHILDAFKMIDKEGVPKRMASTSYDVVHEGKKYPPKLVISYANFFANGDKLKVSKFGGGPNKWAFKTVTDAGFEIIKKNDNEIIVDDAQICLIGGSSIPEYADHVQHQIENNGAIALWWSFPIVSEVQDQLEDPFYVYHNEGNGRVRYRYLVEEYVTSTGEAGIVSPWPEITDDSNVDEYRIPGSNKKSQIFKTWFRVTKIEILSKQLHVQNDFISLIEGRHLTNRNGFGYAKLKKSGLEYSEISTNEDKRLRVMEEKNQDVNAPLNQILYGPPGTGKTYNTINEALAVLEPSLDIEAFDRSALKAKFDQYVSAGRIHFVTFHQSFSYEDFVEGLRASSDNGAISYSVEPGVFKKACMAAARKSGEVSVDELLNQFIDEVSETPIELTTLRGKTFTVSYKGNTTFTCVPHSSEVSRELPANIEHVRQVLHGVQPEKIYCESYVKGIAKHVKAMSAVTGASFTVGQRFGNYEVVAVSDELVEVLKPNGSVVPFAQSMLNSLADFVRSGAITVDDLKDSGWNDKVESTLEKYIVNGYYNLIPFMVEHLVNGTSVVANNATTEPVVLIIDEINRGNISSIFGELITLIEPSKRAGADEALSVTLPYSKERFSVPDNLYLIGTMNTADRSLALMDTALRRRFDFVEMMPEPELLSGVKVLDIDIELMLATLNKRIEVLYDREHTLGHAFFMPLKDSEGDVQVLSDDEKFTLLQGIFSNKILPLLEEYFFEDWEKIRLVLGDNQKVKEEQKPLQFIKELTDEYDSQRLFGNTDMDAYALGAEDTKVYARNDEALKKVDAYKGIYGQ